MTPLRLLAGASMAAVLAAPAAHALPPDQIFERASAAVWSVKSYTGEERLIASASGVVIAPGKLVTSCQVLARARQVQLRQGNTIFDAKLEYPDVERDLCQLDAPGLPAAPLATGTARGLRTGQRLYLVGFSRGHQPSLGEGLVSAVADAGTGKERIQTSIPGAPSLLGAALLDEDGRLVGIVTSTPKDAPATVFAVPADWLAELAARGKAALAARAAAPAAAAASAGPGLPAAGTTWTYSYIEKAYGRRQVELSVRVLRVDGAIVEEVVTTTGGSGVDTHRTVNGYPLGSPGLPSWVTKATVQGWEQVAVPAGTFKALRVDVAGRRGAPIGARSSFAGHFTMSVWYAQAVKRIVRLEHRTWTADGTLGHPGDTSSLAADEVLELLSYRPPS